MKGIKTHFGVIISLVALLFSVHFVFFMNSLIGSYENLMRDEYNIIAVCKNDINATNIAEIKSIDLIDPTQMLEKLDGKISKDSLEKLKATLPNFYSITLSSFPDSKKLDEISTKLKKIEGVSRVEVFAKAHSNIYKILLLIKNIVLFFSTLIVILGLMLMFKQMRIWLFEHKKRVEIMTLFGAPYLIKSFVLYKMAFLDSIVATAIVTLAYYLLPNLSFFSELTQVVGLNLETISLPNDSIFLLLLSLFLSLSTVTIVMFSIKEER